MALGKRRKVAVTRDKVWASSALALFQASR